MYAKGRHLVRKCFTQTLQSELARAVESLERDADHAADGAHQHDAPATLRPHGGQHLLQHSHAAPEVRLQLGLCLLDSALLDRTGQAPSSGSDERVDPAAGGQHARHTGTHRIVIVDVHDQAGPPTRGRVAPACSRDGPAGRMQLLGAGPADASRRSGDQCPPRSVAHGCSDLPAGPDSPADKPVTESAGRHRPGAPAAHQAPHRTGQPHFTARRLCHGHATLAIPAALAVGPFQTANSTKTRTDGADVARGGGASVIITAWA
jgi:hypothetical protein